MLLKPTIYKALLITTLALIACNAALGVVTMAVAGGAIDRAYATALAGNVFVGILMCGLGVFVFSVVMLVGAKRSHMPLYIGATCSVALLALTLLLVGALSTEPAATSTYIYSARFEEHWYQAAPSQRIEIERAFGCCGLTGPGDFYGANWNATCTPPTPAGLARAACCVGMRLGIGQNVSTLAGSCGVAELRYACCSSTTQWPCYRMPPCLGAVVEWFSTTNAAVRHTSVGIAIALLFSLVAQLVALLVMRAHYHAKEAELNGFSSLDDETTL